MQTGSTERRVARVVLEAPIASFRYPHFLIATQPTFGVPPPSTIHGLLAVASGEYPDPASFEFAYTCTARAKFTDLEHQHIIFRAGGTLTDSQTRYPKNVEGSVQPNLRESLFGVRLELFIDPPELAASFLRPAFCLSLGRSQDLATVVSVEECTLSLQSAAYLENTLLPFSDRPFLPQGITLQMPSRIGPAPLRETRFDRYIHLSTRIFAGPPPVGPTPAPSRSFLSPEPREWWVDSLSPCIQGLHRAAVFHRIPSA